jgi:hypothetical protein
VSHRSHIASAIDALLAERNHLRARIEKVDVAIAAVREAFHLPDEENRLKGTRRTHAVEASANGNRHRPALYDEAIRTALRSGPRRPGELATALGVAKYTLRQQLRELEARKIVVVTGTRNSRRVALAKEAP